MQEHIPLAASRLAALRTSIRSLGLNGFIVPKGDAFQNESVPPHWDRLAWLTGFTGSAGSAVVLEDKAALIVDSRYTLQAKAQVDSSLYAVELFPKTKVNSYLGANVPKGAAIGYDPTLHTVAGLKPLKKEAESAGFELRPVTPNPMDALWEGRPAACYFPISLHGEEYAGEGAASKIARVQKAIEEKKAGGLFVSAPDAVAWLFNIRGRDVAHTPAPLVWAYVPVSGKPAVFTFPGHITPDNRGALEALANIHDLASLTEALTGLVGQGAKVIADPAHTTLHVADALKNAGASLIETTDPCALFKARKNAVELQGARNAHIRDGAALCRFLAWLDAEAPSGALTEIAASDRLEAFRRNTNQLEDLSFDTISGAGSNGAIVHYRATPQTNKMLGRERSISSIRGGSIATALRMLRARLRSARRPRRCGGAIRSCSRATSQLRRLASPPARAAWTSTPSHGGRFGRLASITATAPDTASAVSCRCMKGHSRSRATEWLSLSRA